MESRPAFIFSMALMLGLALLGIAAMLVIMNIFIAVIVPTIPDILTDVPTLYDYDETGSRILSQEYEGLPENVELEIENIRSQQNELQIQMQEAVQNKDWDTYQSLQGQVDSSTKKLESLTYGELTHPNQRMQLYWLFGGPALIILTVMIGFSIASYYWEQSFSIIKRGTSASVIKNSIIGIIVIILLPEFWDIYAIHMKQFALYLLDPFNGQPEITTQRLWCKMGCIVNIDEVLDQSVWEIALSSPSSFGQALLTNALLPVFKAVPTAMLSISLFVIAKVRVLFIMVILITIPIWMVAKNVPFISKHSDDMISNMIGASIAPIFSALTLFVGLTYIDSQPNPALEEWISVLAIGIFASLWPVILAPKLSIIASTTTSMVQTALQSGAMMAAGASGGMGSSMAASGALSRGGMSRGMQLKTLFSQGMMGASMGAGQHLTPMNVQNRQGVTDMMNKGLGESAVSSQVADINSMNPNLVDSQISNGVMHSPANHLAGLHGMDEGNAALGSPGYNNMIHQKINHLPSQQQPSAFNQLDAGFRATPASIPRGLNQI